MEALDLDFEDMVASEDEGSEIISEEEVDSDLLEEISEVIAEHISTLAEDASDENIDELLESDELLEKIMKVYSAKAKGMSPSDIKKKAKESAKYYKKNKNKIKKKAAKYRKKVASGAKKVVKRVLVKHNDPSDSNEVGDEKIEESPYDAKEDIEALVGEDSDLSEEFKTKATTIFEAAVNREIEKRSKQLEESFEDALTECTEEVISEITDQVDSYLNHIAEEWLSLNELAVTNGIKSDLSENLLKGMKELFDLHYIEVPEQKVDVVEEFAAKIEDLEQRLNNQLNENISLKSQLDDKTKLEVVNEMTFDLVETEVEKLKELSEAVDFTGDVDDYKEKVSVIKESYFGGNPTSTHEDVEDTSDTVQDLSESMSIYTNVLSRSMK